VNEHKILVCIDGSEQAMQAAGYIGAVMAKQDRDLVLFHVMKNTCNSLMDSKDPDSDFFENGAGATAQGKKSKNDPSDKIIKTKQILLEIGIPEKQIQVKLRNKKIGIARDIVAESKKGYDAVVVGRKGLRKIKHVFFGGIPFKLLATLDHTPLCIVGGEPETRKFLLALNGSRDSVATAQKASALLKNPSLEVHMLNVLKGYDPFDPSEILEYKNRIQERELIMQDVFQDAKTHFINAGMTRDRITSHIVTHANLAAETIIDESQKNSCGSIVIGTSANSKLTDLTDSVGHSLVRLSKKKAVWVMNL